MERQFTCTRDNPVIQTDKGKIRGFKIDSTYTFHGIKYADSKRFQQPTEVEPWEGVKDALTYGYVSPLLEQRKLPNEILVPHRYWLMDEDCQYMNIWTQSINSSERKPVMLWLHGGGFMAGSSIEHLAYDGENLSKYGDVVVVSINHRLNVLGYLNMSDFGEKYANSGNAGNADMVYALKWIQRNIDKFGGDPDNVTIFGQSGGGMKVASLMQTPEADGLFHKGIIQSGVVNDDTPPKADEGKEIVKIMLDELELSLDEVEQLETLAYPELSRVFRIAIGKVIKRTGGLMHGAPLVNDYYLGDARKIGFTEHAKTIPVMVGSTFGEFNFEQGIDRFAVAEDKLDELLEKEYGSQYTELKVLFAKAYPARPMADLLDVDSVFRYASKDYIAKKSLCTEAPTYSYLFAYDFDYDNGKPAWHCAEIPFVFHNMDKVPVYNMPGVSEKMQENIFRAWVNFAKYGDPNHDGLPHWPKCTDGDEATMILKADSEVVHNHDDELMELHFKLAKNPFVARKKMEH